MEEGRPWRIILSSISLRLGSLVGKKGENMGVKKVAKEAIRAGDTEPNTIIAKYTHNDLLFSRTPL